METRSIGATRVAEIGFGCMNLNHAYGVPLTREAATNLLHRAVELGVTHFDTAALYGFGTNEEWVGAALEPYRSQIHLASKCGMTGVGGKRVIDGRPETLKRTCAEALQRLRFEHIDLYYLHRWDRNVPVEESVGALAEMVRAGWVREIGLSEVSAVTLRKAHEVHPIAAVQVEYSLWTRNAEIALLDACRELGTAFVAFSPLGRGFLAGAIEDPGRLAPSDIRRGMPRFQEPHFTRNRALYERFAVLAREAGCSAAQLALAWLLHEAPFIVPVIGTTNRDHLAEDIAAAEMDLPEDMLTRADQLVNHGTVSGARYPASTLEEIDTEDMPTPA